MALDFWKSIGAGRFFDGALWTSNLSIDHLARHFALFGVVGTSQIRQASRSSVGIVDRTITVCFPDSWDLDESFAAARLVLQVEVSVAEIGGNATGTIFLVGGSNAPTLIAGPRYLTKDYTSPLPTGLQTETIRMDVTGVGTSVNFASFPETGIGCSWQVVPE